MSKKNNTEKKSNQQVKAEVRYSDDLRDIAWVRENIPCQTACPADTNIPGYIRSIFEERYGEAYETNRDANVLPGVLGRICSRPCEDNCRHGWPGNGEPVGICNLKRVSADNSKIEPTKTTYKSTGKKIAIVGAGPAGISAARSLSVLGHDVTILEREKTAGGMLAYGIPAFRLPRDILNPEIKNATNLGVSIKTGVTVGKDKGDTLVSSLVKEYDAVLLATGCMAAIPLPLRDTKKDEDPAEGLDNVENGLNFLMELHRGEKKKVGKRTAVLGAGFTALDCARVARRLGAEEVTIHLRTGEEYIPVSKEEIFETKREGIKIKGLRSPASIVTDDKGNLKGVEFVQNRLGGWRANGRRAAIPIEGSEFIEECDTVLIAIGQKTVNDYLDIKLDLDKWGNVAISKDGMTSTKGLFAAGDYVNGASTAIEAIGHSQEVAIKIDEWLMGSVRRKKIVRIEPVEAPLRERAFDFIPKEHMPTVDLDKRFEGLEKEAEKGLSKTSAAEESKRCYLCNLKYKIDVSNCIYCRACIEVAPRNCIKLIKGVDVEKDGRYNASEAEKWNEVAAIWIDNKECIRCGACYMVCPTKCISISRNELVNKDV